MNFIGETAALSASIVWAGCNFALQQYIDLFSPIMLCFVKCSISTVFLFMIVNLFGIDLFPVAETAPYIKLMLSGIFGIAIGDSFFFVALNELGARKALLIETLAPPMTGIIAFMYYGSTISLIGWIGVGLTLYGLFVVVSDREEHHESELAEQLVVLTTTDSPLPQSYVKSNVESVKPSPLKQIFSKGLIFGAAAMLFASLGIVLSSSVVSTGQFNSLASTLIRIAPTNLVLFPTLKYYRKERFVWPSLSLLNNLSLIATILVSTIFCIWMSQVSLVYTRPEISQTLIATSPLFGLLIGRFKGESISKKQVIGSLVSVFGVVLIVQA